MPSKVRVDVSGQDRSAKLGLHGVVLAVTRQDGVAAAGKTSVEVDYSRFASAIGGDWASRLRLVSLPACALTTPQLARCQTGTPVQSRNDVKSKRVSAEVTIPASTAASGGRSGGAAVLAVTAGSSGPAGSYAATSLAPSATWQVSQQTGDFSWSYRLRVPPAVNGPTPSLAINYSSGSVDGRTASANNQTSWLGEGHSLETGYVERKYVTCRDDQGTGANNTTKTSDQCWKTDNASVVLGGHSGELIKASDGTWRIENDDASRMERVYGAMNDDNDKEYWRLTTSDGTQYYFGLGKRYAADSAANTDSTWVSPVFGNHPGEPCRAATFAASSCQQAWRWNLDYVVDPHGNTMTFYYAREKNNYGRNNNTAISTYDRGGWLSRIEYGERKGTEATTAAPMRVRLSVAERCIPSGTITCAEGQLNNATKGAWPDLPFDQICKSTTSCPDGRSPTFFTRKRLVGVTTEVMSGTAYAPVDEWAFVQSLPMPGDGTTTASLWLNSITHTGKVGGSAPLPAITFAGEQLYNRVDGLDSAPAMDKLRVAKITSETGSVISVNYPKPDCTPESLPASPHTNTRKCFPVFWAGDGDDDPKMHYFHKYPVQSVVEDDLTGGAPDKMTAYTYVGPAAWHYDDNELTLPKYRTYGQWRGFGEVRASTGTPGQSPVTLTKSIYMRGMHGDPLPGGARRSASVTDSKGGVITDHARANGFVREQVSYNGVGGAEVSGTINDPWISAATAGSGEKLAQLLQTGKSRTRTALAGGGERTTEVNTMFDGYGMPVVVGDRGDVTVAADDLCTRTERVHNTSAWILGQESRVSTRAKACDAPVPSEIVSDVRTYYDGADSLTAPPTKGAVTRTEMLADGGVYKTTARLSYDAHGRVTETFDALNRKSTVAYTPATGGPVTETTAANALGHVSKTMVNPAWGVPDAEIDANSRRTDLAYDPLGRLTSVWLPGRAKATKTPHMKFAYLVRNNGAVAVSSSELLRDGVTYKTSHALLDGLLRPRQTQVQTVDLSGGLDKNGRVLTETTYNELGLPEKSNGPFYAEGAPSTDLFVPATDHHFESQNTTTYDGAGRPTAQAFNVLGDLKWRTTTTYGGDRVTVDPPTGATPTTTIADARGRTTALRQYKGEAPAGAYDETTYTYTPDGKRKSVTDAAGNAWSYEYDQQGRLTTANDPDRGTTKTTFDDASQVVSIEDARGQRLFYEYDLLGRKTAARKDSATGPLQGSWTFDTVKDAAGKALVGHPATSTRWVGENAYTTAVAGYDIMYRPTGGEVTVPAAEGDLAGTYATSMRYHVDGSVDEVDLPAAPGLLSETLETHYDALGSPVALLGRGAYVPGVQRSPFGELLRMTLGHDKLTWQSFSYEQGTRRLKRSKVEREGRAGTVSDATYDYDDAGNLTQVTDAPTDDFADTQCFKYDYLRRFTDAWTPQTEDCGAAPSAAALGGPAPYWHSYGYDVTGNRTKEVHHQASGDTVRTYEYPAARQSRPHALAKVTTDSAAGQRLETFEYDEVGNTTSRSFAGSKQTLTWDVEGRLASATDGKGTTEFLYDADGERLIRRDPQATTLYLDGTEIKLDRASKVKSATRYYSFSGKTVAMRTATGVQMFVSDHHGTAQLAIDRTTGDVTRRRSLPFGGSRDRNPAPWTGDRGFVGGTIDASTGLTHMGAREYDPEHGRFISVDPVIDHNDPQQMNGYAYGNNAPATFSDPTGLISADSAERLANNGVDLSNDFNGAPKKSTPRTTRDRAEADLDAAVKRREQHKRTVIKLAKQLAKIVADELGITAGLNCFTRGDIGACAETAVNVLSMFVGGLLGKIATKYAWRWKAAAKLFNRLKDIGGRLVDAIGGWMKQSKAADKARAILRRTPERCETNSFVPGTKVLLANGKKKDIDKLVVGDRVLAADPVKGKSASRSVVATYASAGQKRLVEISVGTAGSRPRTVTATGNHPFWADDRRAWVPAGALVVGEHVRTAAGQRVAVMAVRERSAQQRVHNLSVDDIHTYHVMAGATPVLVHNCPAGVPNLRQQYVDEVNGLGRLGDTLQETGASPELTARVLHAQRRLIGERYKDLTPADMLETIHQRNLDKYGDKLGPGIDYLRGRGKSWEDIIESASRTGGKDLGL